MTEIIELLAQANVHRVLIVDDAYDRVPLAMDLANDADEWTKFFDDLSDDDEEILRELYLNYDALRSDELQNDDAFVAALWRGSGRIRAELLDPLLARYRSASEVDLAHLGALKTSLEGFGLNCDTAGRTFSPASAEADLIVIDLFLGSGQRPDDMEIAIAGLTDVILSRPARPPLVVLMSRSSRLEGKREEFRDRCGLFASAFRIIRKTDLADQGKLGRLLTRLATHFGDSLKLATFVGAWRAGLDGARDRTSALIRRLELSDYAQIRQLLLSTEGEPTGSYLVDVFDAVLRHEIEGEASIIDGAIGLNALTPDTYPPPYCGGSRDLQDLVQRSMFQNRERLRPQGAENSRIAFGDVLMRKPLDAKAVPGGTDVQVQAIHGIDAHQVLLTVTPACDLQRQGQGQGAKNILLLVGWLSPLRPADWQYKADPVRTPVIELADGSRHLIKWDLKHVLSLSAAEIGRLFDDPMGFTTVARLRESHALELQQKLLSSLGRVGLVAPMPATFLMKVELLLPGVDKKLIRVSVPALGEGGVCFVGRSGENDMRLVLTEDQCEGISDAIGAFNIAQIHPTAHTAFTYLRESSDLLIALERGITLPTPQQLNFKKILSPTGPVLGSNIRTIGWIVRNRPMDDAALSTAELLNAGIVLATWDHDRLGAA